MPPATKRPSRQPSTGDELEARVAQVWFWEGHFARRGINLQRFYHPDPLQVTDLDLLAFEFGPNLRRWKFVGEAKGGKGKDAKPLDRIVWLAGLRQLTHADGAELTSAIAPSDRVRKLGTSMGVTAQSTIDLERREDRVRIKEVENLGSQGPAFLESLERVHRTCSGDPDLSKAFWFLRSDAWLIGPWSGLKKTMSLIGDIAKKKVAGLSADEDHALRWLIAEAMTLACVNVITVSAEAATLDEAQFRDLVGERLADGLAPARDMARISKAVDKYIGGILQEAAVRAELVTKAMGAFEPVPPNYAEPLAEVARRLAWGSVHARHIPRLVDLVVFERVLHGRDVSPSAVDRLGLSNPELVARAARLIASFLVGQAGLPREFIEALDNIVPADASGQSGEAGDAPRKSQGWGGSDRVEQLSLNDDE